MTGRVDDRGDGVSGFGVAKEEEKPFSGTGGAAGPGTRAGEGEPSGEDIGTKNAAKNEAAKEASALGNFEDHDETPALEYGEIDRPRGPTIGEALGTGAGTNVGSGTPPTEAIGGGTAAIDETAEDGGGGRTPAGAGSD